MGCRFVCHAFWCVLLVAGPVFSQEPLEFELVVPGSDIVSRAERTETRLEITDELGRVTKYARVRLHDSADGEYLGYYSEVDSQVIRWPVNNRGNMLIGTILTDGLSPFRRSRMEIRPLGPAPESVVEFHVDPNAAYELTTMTNEGRSVVMEAHVDSHVIMRRKAEVDTQLWHFMPVGNGYYRIHSHSRGRRWSLSSKPAQQPRLEVTDDTADQLWRLTPSPSEPGYVLLSSASGSSRDLVLTSSPTGRVEVKHFDYGPDQLWQLKAIETELPQVFEEYSYNSGEIRPAEPLAAAEIEMVNSHRKELWVLITDSFDPARSVRLRIPPGERRVVSLERDPGGTALEVYEQHLPNGVVQVDQFVTPLPPAPRYDVSVYEVIVQSVAIDRTVPGGRVEEVNFVPRSIGWFDLASGPDLENGLLDVYEMAKSMNNPGAARRIDPSLWQSTEAKPDPVESALHDVLDRTDK